MQNCARSGRISFTSTAKKFRWCILVCASSSWTAHLKVEALVHCQPQNNYLSCVSWFLTQKGFWIEKKGIICPEYNKILPSKTVSRTNQNIGKLQNNQNIGWWWSQCLLTDSFSSWGDNGLSGRYVLFCRLAHNQRRWNWTGVPNSSASSSCEAI